jgi:hypothetical protein
MTITIDPFALGVIVGALGMLLVLVVYGSVKGKKEKKEDK